MKRYILTAPATRDINEILDYIARQSVQTAVVVAQRFEKAFQRIVDFPSVGHVRSELKDTNARIIFVSGYLIVFDPTLKPIHILRVIRGARDLRKIELRA